ncbi:MAG: hypothetical protein V4486_00150 [Patescibacteria group bacterium]
MKKIFAWLLLLFLFLPGTARAQTAEKTLHLERGRWLWTLLINEGCTKAETAKLWPKVATDNGLPLNKEKVWQPQTLILKRDCRGESLEVIALRKQVAEFPGKLQELQDKADKRLADELAKKDAEIAQLRRSGIVLGLLGLAAGVGIGWIIRGRRVPEIKSASPLVETLDPKIVAVPREITVEHWGKDWGFVLTQPQYKCPVCGEVVGDEVEAREHLEAEHKEEGHISFKTTDPLRPDSEFPDEMVGSQTRHFPRGEK